MKPPTSPLDPACVFGTPLVWTTDEFPWLSAEYDQERIFVRLNTSFPDEPLYSLLIDEDVTVEFDDFPPTWTQGPLNWAEQDRK